jgi:protein-tyrosine-phosphatase
MSPRAAGEPYTVLFVCTGNAARSILAEAILNRLGAPAFRAYSAGSHPKDAVHPGALALLRDQGFDTERLRPKGWAEFAAPGAPRLDCVITVCDNAANEACPAWPGAPASAHWSIPEPADADGLADAFRLLHARITALVAEPPGGA